VARLHFPRLAATDVIAGTSVAMVLIPQSLAYAELAQLPPYIGLFASAFPLLVFALLASSPYLQTGPVAVTSLLTIAALPDVSPVELPAIAALMAFMVGAMRVSFGIARLGQVVRLMSAPVVMGFMSGAAIVIMSSQLPKALGVSPPDGGVLWQAAWSLVHPGAWLGPSVVLSVVTVVLFLGGRRISPLFPGVLFAVIIGIVYSRTRGYSGPTIDEIPEGLPPISFNLPWDQIPTLLLGAIIIALVGFAEPASIARTFANETGERWDANQEMIASGAANFVAAFSGGYPVGGSFSRSSINRLAGAKTRWSGGVTGLIVIAFLPFASVLEPLPTAVLGAIVLAAASSLVKPLKLLRLWQRTKTQALLAWATAGAVLAFTPRVERAVILGVILTTVLHLSCRFSMDHVRDESGRITVQPVGMIWLANDAKFEQGLRDAAKGSDNGVTVDFARIPFLNDATIDAMSAVRLELNAAGHALDWTDPPAGSERMLSAVTTRPEPTQAIDGGTGG
jgi:SulP family sulfate permease